MKLLMNLLLLVLVCVNTGPAHAALSSRKSYSASGESNTTGIPAPYRIRRGDFLLGARTALGGVYEGSAILGLSGEFILHPNFGMGLQVAHSGYSQTFGNAWVSGSWEYDIWAIHAFGTLHANIFKVRDLDTYISLGLGRAFVSSSVQSTPNADAPWWGTQPTLAAADASAFYVTGSANARYFFNPKLAGVASLGLGLGYAGVGLDYLF